MVTIIATRQQQERVNFLLELTSALNGVGVRIGRAIIQSCTDCGVPVADPDFPTEAEHGRLYKIWGTDRCASALQAPSRPPKHKPGNIEPLDSRTLNFVAPYWPHGVPTQDDGAANIAQDSR